jgi:hypothetical protein
MDIGKKLESIAKAQGLEIEEVRQLWNKLRAQMKDAPERIVYNRLLSQIARESAISEGAQAKLGYFIGFLVGDPGMRDQAEEMRDRAERVIDQYGFDYAKEKGFVNEAGEVLDTRTVVFGRKNPNFGQPISEGMHIRSHRLYLICREVNSEKYELAHLQTNDNRLALAWCKLPFYTWVKFPALIQEHDTTGYRLTGTTSRNALFKSEDGKPLYFQRVDEKRDTYEVYEEVFKPQITPIKDVEKYHEAVKDAWDRWVVTYGIVSYLGLDRETFFGMPGRLIDVDMGYDPEYQVRFYVPHHLKIDFGLYSEAYLFGRTRRAKYRDPESGELVDADVVIDAWGFYPNPKYKTETTHEELLEEEEIEGFIPF